MYVFKTLAHCMKSNSLPRNRNTNVISIIGHCQETEESLTTCALWVDICTFSWCFKWTLLVKNISNLVISPKLNSASSSVQQQSQQKRDFWAGWETIGSIMTVITHLIRKLNSQRSVYFAARYLDIVNNFFFFLR